MMRRKRTEGAAAPAKGRPLARPRDRAGGVPQAIAALALIALLAALRSCWAAGLVELGLLAVVPGVLLLRALRVPGHAIAGFPIYIPCASLIVILASGLAVDLIGPPLGIGAPLRTAPMLVALEALCLVLLAAGARAPRAARVPWARLVPSARECWPLALPALSGAGALWFANGHGAFGAILGLLAALLALTACALAAPRLSRRQLALALYGIGLAALWSFALRNHFVYGYDVATEFHIARETIASGIWHSHHPHDPYGAMLSLTVLPAALHELAGVTPLTALQALFPALIALFPVGLFALASRVLERRWAFLAAAFVAAQSYFFQELPSLARQEIALLFFVTLVAAMFDARVSRRARWPLLALLALGVTVSHYTTAYLTIGMLAGSVVIQLIVSARRPLFRLSMPVLVALVSTAVGAGVWYGAITDSTSNLSQLGSDLSKHGLDLLPNAKAGQSLIQSYLTGNSPTRISVADYQADALRRYRRGQLKIHPLAAAAEPRYAVHDTTPPGSGAAPALDGVLRAPQLLFNQLANLLAVLGAIALTLRRDVRPRARQLGILGVAMLGILAVVRLSGTAASAYNQERAFVQTMVPLAIAMAWTVQAAARRWPRWRAGLGLAAAAGLLALFLGSSGLRPVLSGAGRPLSVAASGEDYDRFLITPTELAAAAWYAAAPRPGLLYADRYGRLRVLSQTGREAGLVSDLLPVTLDREAWIYASGANLRGVARAPSGSLGFATYTWPAAFIDRFFARVYDNGGAEVFHR